MLIDFCLVLLVRQVLEDLLVIVVVRKEGRVRDKRVLGVSGILVGFKVMIGCNYQGGECRGVGRVMGEDQDFQCYGVDILWCSWVFERFIYFSFSFFLSLFFGIVRIYRGIMLESV